MGIEEDTLACGSVAIIFSSPGLVITETREWRERSVPLRIEWPTGEEGLSQQLGYVGKTSQQRICWSSGNETIYPMQRDLMRPTSAEVVA